MPRARVKTPSPRISLKVEIINNEIMLETINGIDLLFFITGSLIFYAVGRNHQRTIDQKKRSELNLNN